MTLLLREKVSPVLEAELSMGVFARCDLSVRRRSRFLLLKSGSELLLRGNKLPDSVNVYDIDYLY